eukprot:2743371-Amphidinium_carterae.1
MREKVLKNAYFLDVLVTFELFYLFLLGNFGGGGGGTIFDSDCNLLEKDIQCHALHFSGTHAFQ